MESSALDDYIKANYKTKELLEIAEICGVTRSTVFRHAKALGLSKYNIDSNRVINRRAQKRIEINGNVTRHNLI